MRPVTSFWPLPAAATFWSRTRCRRSRPISHEEPGSETPLRSREAIPVVYAGGDSPRTGHHCRRRSGSDRLPSAPLLGPQAHLAEFGDLGLCQMLDTDKIVLRLACPDEFVELCLDCRAVSVLGALNQEDHQECDDGRPGVDDELPCFGEAEDRSADGPSCYCQDAKRKGSWATRPTRNGVGET